MINVTNIPLKLRENGNWVVRDGKVPYDPMTNKPAKTNDITTFADFETAYNCYAHNSYSGMGLGLFDNLYAIDLDHCIDNGVLSQEAEIIVEAFASYTEISPSGDGLHIIGYINDFIFDNEKYYINNQKQNIEVYIAGATTKYITVTGNRYNDFDISTCNNSTMQKFLDSFMVKQVKSNTLLSAFPPINPDIDYLTIGLEKDKKLNRYYNGERVLNDKSESENDLGFMCKLMYWCNNDTEKALTAFLESPYSLKKDEKHKIKLQRQDYINSLLQSAIQQNNAYSDSVGYMKEKTYNNYYNLVSAVELHNTEFTPLEYFVEDILPEGTSILAAAPKCGKSWFVLDLALKLASGELFLGKRTTRTEVLYLALEDSKRRLQDRMNKIQKDRKIPDGVFFLTDIPNLDNGFIQAVDSMLTEHREIKLIIIDTFQKIRGQAQPRELLYQYDYREMGVLKQFADKRGISLLFVHHTRKMKDKDDPNNMISGSNGISGAVDTVLVMTKTCRDDEDTKLHISGRDVNQNTILIKFDEYSYEWVALGNQQDINAKKEYEEFNNNPVVKTIKHLLNVNNDEWSGYAKDIVKAGNDLNFVMPSPARVGYTIKSFSSIFEKYFIEYKQIDRGKTNSNKYHFRYIISEN